MDIIYNEIAKRIRANDQLFKSNGMTPIRHFDIFKGQYINPQLHHSYLKPALFYSWSAQWEDAGDLLQKGKITVQVHLELDIRSKSFYGSKDKDSALLFFRYQCYVNALLHGFGTDYFNPLKRRSDTPDENPTDTNVHIITYEMTLIDDTARQLRDSGYTFAAGEQLSITDRIRDRKPEEEGRDSSYVI